MLLLTIHSIIVFHLLIIMSKCLAHHNSMDVTRYTRFQQQRDANGQTRKRDVRRTHISIVPIMLTPPCTFLRM
jgi:hypothetical protein